MSYPTLAVLVPVADWEQGVQRSVMNTGSVWIPQVQCIAMQPEQTQSMGQQVQQPTQACISRSMMQCQGQQYLQVQCPPQQFQQQVPQNGQVQEFIHTTPGFGHTEEASQQCQRRAARRELELELDGLVQKTSSRASEKKSARAQQRFQDEIQRKFIQKLEMEKQLKEFENFQRMQQAQFLMFQQRQFKDRGGAFSRKDTPRTCSQSTDLDSRRASTCPTPQSQDLESQEESEQQMRKKERTAGVTRIGMRVHQDTLTQDRCIELLQEIEELPHGGVPSEILAEIAASVELLSRDIRGCRLVQAALDKVGESEAFQLLHGMRGQVCECTVSAHGNHVVQKAVCCGPSIAEFIAGELLGRGANMARHRYGCRIMCRLVENAMSLDSVRRLVGEVLVEAVTNCRHSFAHHVIQTIVEHGLKRHRSIIAEAMFEEPLANACHRSAIYVIESVILHGTDEDRSDALKLLGSVEAVDTMARSQYGCYVISALLRLEGFDRARARACLEELADQLGETKYGTKVLEDLSLL